MKKKPPQRPKRRARELKARLDKIGPSPAVTHEVGPDGGRARSIVDERTLAGLAAIHCSYEEMGAILGVSEDTLRKNPEYVAIVDKERLAGKMGLRQAQFRSALNGNATMLIWLGKLYLGQNPDRPEGSNDPDDTDMDFVVYKWKGNDLPMTPGLDAARA